MRTVLTVDDEGMLTFPPEMLEELGWKDGDVLQWIDNKDGSFQLKKMSEEKQYSKYRLDQLAKELGGKWYHQTVSNSHTEYKRIVIEYGTNRKGKDL